MSDEYTGTVTRFLVMQGEQKVVVAIDGQPKSTITFNRVGAPEDWDIKLGMRLRFNTSSEHGGIIMAAEHDGAPILATVRKLDPNPN